VLPEKMISIEIVFLVYGLFELMLCPLAIVVYVASLAAIRNCAPDLSYCVAFFSRTGELVDSDTR
jgi:hypothetical protein